MSGKKGGYKLHYEEIPLFKKLKKTKKPAKTSVVYIAFNRLLNSRFVHTVLSWIQRFRASSRSK